MFEPLLLTLQLCVLAGLRPKVRNDQPDETFALRSASQPPATSGLLSIVKEREGASSGAGSEVTLQQGFRIGEWLARPETGEIERDGLRRALSVQQMRLLTFLAANPLQVVSRQRLVDHLWPETVVVESSLTRCVSELRGLLEDDARNPRYIETLPKRGYRLLQVPHPLSGDARDAAPRTAAPRDRVFRRWMGGVAAGLALFAVAALGWIYAQRGREPRPGPDFAVTATVPRHQEGGAEAAAALARAEQHLQRLEVVAARPLYEEILRADPSHPLAHRGLAEAFYTLGHLRAAREHAQLAVAGSDRLPETRRERVLAWRALTLGHPAEAVPLLSGLLQESPEDTRLRLDLAEALLRDAAVGRAGEVVSLFEAQRLEPQVRFRVGLLRAEVELAANRPGVVLDLVEWASDGDQAPPTLMTVRAAIVRGRALVKAGHLDEGLAVLRSSRDAAVGFGDLRGQSQAMLAMALHTQEAGDDAQAEELFASVLALARSSGDWETQARAALGLASAARSAGHREQAAQLLGEARVLVARYGLSGLEATLHHAQALDAIIRRGDLDAAQQDFERALALFRERGALSQSAAVLNNLGKLRLMARDTRAAAQRLAEANALYRRLGDLDGFSTTRFNEGFLFIQQGRMAEARSALMESLSAFRSLGNERMVAASLAGLGESVAAMGQLAEARRQMEEALELRVRLGARMNVLESRLQLAELALQEGDLHRAEIEARAVESEQRAMQARFLHALRVRAESLLRRGRVAETATLLGEVDRSRHDDSISAVLLQVLEAEVLAATGEYLRAAALLDETQRAHGEERSWAIWAEAELARGVVELASGRGDVAQDRLEQLAQEAARRGWRDLERRAARVAGGTLPW